jgi:hypothetical protein
MMFGATVTMKRTHGMWTRMKSNAARKSQIRHYLRQEGPHRTGQLRWQDRADTPRNPWRYDGWRQMSRAIAVEFPFRPEAARLNPQSIEIMKMPLAENPRSGTRIGEYPRISCQDECGHQNGWQARCNERGTSA